MVSFGHAKILKFKMPILCIFFFSLGVYREFKCLTHHSIDLVYKSSPAQYLKTNTFISLNWIMIYWDVCI